MARKKTEVHSLVQRELWWGLGSVSSGVGLGCMDSNPLSHASPYPLFLTKNLQCQRPETQLWTMTQGKLINFYEDGKHYSGLVGAELKVWSPQASLRMAVRLSVRESEFYTQIDLEQGPSKLFFKRPDNSLSFVGQATKWRLLCAYEYNYLKCNHLKV